MKTCVIVGSGYRGLYMFGQRLVSDPYKNMIHLTACCDINRLRAEHFARECGGLDVYTDFDRMLDEQKPDIVIVTTVDAVHDEYIVRALDRGCDVISEKPMTVNAEKAKSIQDAELRSGKSVKVVFNMRYMPLQQRIKELLAEGAVGEIYSVDLEWSLDRAHGADYFRRWHAQMEKSGGLLIHKSTHHFDLINWWLNDEPDNVYASGDLRFYGPNREERGDKCRSCAYKDSCEFFWDITADPVYRDMYLNTESEDGYIRDNCVFRDSIDIYDTMKVQVQYKGGALLNYSLVAYSPFEGWHLNITGSKGRLEVNQVYSGPFLNPDYSEIFLYPVDGEREIVQVPNLAGSHGGGDDRLLMDMLTDGGEDTLGQKATSRDGVYSLIIGAAANRSIEQRVPINIDALIANA